MVQPALGFPDDSRINNFEGLQNYFTINDKPKNLTEMYYK